MKGLQEKILGIMLANNHYYQWSSEADSVSAQEIAELVKGIVDVTMRSTWYKDTEEEVYERVEEYIKER